MAGFLDSIMGIFGGGGGEQAAPQLTSTSDLLGQASGLAVSQLAPATIAYNQALAGPLTDLRLAQERKYNPYAFDVRSGAYKSILDELNLGSSVPAELQDLVTQRTLEGNTASGAGASNLGDIFGARSLLSAGLDLGRQRRMDALNAASASPSLDSIYQTQDPTGLISGIASDIRGREAAINQQARIAQNQQSQKSQQMFKTGLTIAGTVAGGIFGGGIPGAMVGSTAGTLAGNVLFGGGDQGGGGGGGFTSILSGIGGMGGGGVSTPGINPAGGGLGGSNWGLGGTMFAR